jgi:hypothetical protein
MMAENCCWEQACVVTDKFMMLLVDSRRPSALSEGKILEGR